LWGRRKEAAQRRTKVVLPKEEQLFKFLNEGQNGPFNKLLGAPSMSLYVRSIFNLNASPTSPLCSVKISWVIFPTPNIF